VEGVAHRQLDHVVARVGERRHGALHRRQPTDGPAGARESHSDPGEEGQVDFFRGAPTIHPETGQWRRPWVLRLTLACSRHGYEEAARDQKFETFLRLHERAFLDLGGVPSGAIIHSASLKVMSKNGRSNHSVEIRGLLTGWSEMAVTGNSPDGTYPWAGGGAFGSTDYGATVYGALTPVGGDTLLRAMGFLLDPEWKAPKIPPVPRQLAQTRRRPEPEQAQVPAAPESHPAATEVHGGRVAGHVVKGIAQPGAEPPGAGATM